jgi:hypothetical protein
MQFDADAYVLARAAEVMAQCYTAEVAPPDHTYLLCSSSPALQVVMNPRSIKAHSFVLRFHHALTTFFSVHKGRITLCWAPKDDSSEGNWLARSLASQVCSQELPQICLTAWIAFCWLPSRRTAHAGERFTSGNWITDQPGLATYFTLSPQALPWTGQHISTRYPNPPPRSTTLCGLPR